jgi:antitoxin MazE
MDIHLAHVYLWRASMQVAKWGNSLAVRLPTAMVKALDLKPGDELDFRILGERELGIAQRPDLEALLERVRKYRGRMPPDFKFDRWEANEQE